MSMVLAALKRAPSSTRTPHHRPQPRHPRRADDLRREAGRPLCRVRAQPRRLVEGAREIATCAISGSVGTFANIDPASRNMSPESWASPSSRLHARSSRATATPPFSPRSALWSPRRSNAGHEIRHLQRTEVLEAEEPFSPGQKGSSSMPHKRNPVLTENLTGLARMVRVLT
jgi:adenylosuccinate lyase